MEQLIKIGDKEVRFRTSAAIPYLYKNKFNEDIFLAIKKVSDGYKKTKKNELPVEVLEIVQQMAYIMAKHADKSVTDDFVEWLGDFESYDIYMCASEILKLWNSGIRTASIPK